MAPRRATGRWLFGDSAYAGPDTISNLNEVGYEVIA
jgi:hypothetical protein